jgi:predicted dithiol-disulfide oxidoreductase (DUF899 family)
MTASAGDIEEKRGCNYRTDRTVMITVAFAKRNENAVFLTLNIRQRYVDNVVRIPNLLVHVPSGRSRAM